jgi:hypothetical protein
MKYNIKLSMYGTVAESANVEIEATSLKEAERKALKQCEDGEIKFTNKQESVDGWNYQVEKSEVHNG